MDKWSTITVKIPSPRRSERQKQFICSRTERARNLLLFSGCSSVFTASADICMPLARSTTTPGTLQTGRGGAGGSAASRERAEQIIAQQDVKAIALLAYRHAEPTRGGYVPEVGVAVLNVQTGRVYGRQEQPSETVDHASEKDEGPGVEAPILIAPSEYYADRDNPRPTRDQFVNECVSEGLDWDSIRAGLDDIYRWYGG